MQRIYLAEMQYAINERIAMAFDKAGIAISANNTIVNVYSGSDKNNADTQK